MATHKAQQQNAAKPPILFIIVFPFLFQRSNQLQLYRTVVRKKSHEKTTWRFRQVDIFHYEALSAKPEA